MARINYRQLKQRREDAQKREQVAKQSRRGRLPDPPPGTDASQPANGGRR
jgi:hypothetical protein